MSLLLLLGQPPGPVTATDNGDGTVTYSGPGVVSLAWLYGDDNIWAVNGTNVTRDDTAGTGTVTTTATGNLKVWNGSAWAIKPVKVWNGSTWTTKPVKVWNGTAWKLTAY